MLINRTKSVLSLRFYKQVSELRAAEEIKKEFAVSDRRWMWLRAKVLAK